MTRANKKRKLRGDPLQYKNLTNINWSSIDFAVTEDDKKFFDYNGPVTIIKVKKFKKIFMESIKRQINLKKLRKIDTFSIKHVVAVNSALVQVR